MQSVKGVNKEMAPRNIIEKIWDSHVVKQVPGHPAVFAVDLMLIHEVTSAQAFQAIEEKGLRVFDPSRLLATLDHSIPTRTNRHEIFDPEAKNQVETLRRNCRKHGIPLCELDSGTQGVVHVVGPELGVTQPGMTIVCGDSHTATHGACGALAFGIGTSEVAHVLATGCMLQQKPKTMKVEFTGELQKGVYAKDAVLKLIAQIGVGGANGYAIEYTGKAARAMSMEERLTICNMSIECGARAGLFSPDETTYSYLKGRPRAPKQDWEKAVAQWRTVASDPGCSYDKTVAVDLGGLRPMVTWGTTPAQGCTIDGHVPAVSDFPKAEQISIRNALEYMDLKEGQALRGVPIQWAFLGSCTNGRIEDLRLAAQILKDRKVHQGVTMYVVPGSEMVLEEAIKEGLDRIFIAAGADFRMPGCSMCLGMNDDKVPAGMRCISSSNRNFMGRQGPGSRTHLASPATVAASAIEGQITSAEKYL